MDRRRPGSALDVDSFWYYTRREDVYVYQTGLSYVIGQFVGGIFKPSHFAPASIREGVRLFEELLSYDNVVLAVTSDLGSMLSRLGYVGHLQVPMYFREQLVIKEVYATSEELFELLLDAYNRAMAGEEISMESIVFQDAIDVQKRREKYMNWTVTAVEEIYYTSNLWRLLRETGEV